MVEFVDTYLCNFYWISTKANTCLEIFCWWENSVFRNFKVEKHSSSECLYRTYRYDINSNFAGFYYCTLRSCMSKCTSVRTVEHTVYKHGLADPEPDNGIWIRPQKRIYRRHLKSTSTSTIDILSTTLYL